MPLPLPPSLDPHRRPSPQRLESLEEEIGRHLAASPPPPTTPDDDVGRADAEATLGRLVSDLEAEVATSRRAEQLALERVRELEEGLENLRSLEEVRRGVGRRGGDKRPIAACGTRESDYSNDEM